MIHINIDSTSLGAAHCMLKMKRIVLEGYTDPIKPASMVYGVAIHKFCDSMYKTKGDLGVSKDACLAAFRKIPKDIPAKSEHLGDERHMLTTAFYYWENYLKKDGDFELLDRGNGLPMSEMTFSHEIYQDSFITVNLQGTTDGIGKIKGGCYAIRDFKTTSSWDAKNYFGQYELNRQLRIYALALRLQAQKYPDSILGQVGKTRLGAFIDAIFIKPHVADNIYSRSPVYTYSDTDLDEMQELIMSFCNRLSSAIQTNEFQKEGLLNGSCMGKFGRCAFWNVCKNDDKIGEILLKRDFTQKPFEPLRYNEY